MGVFYDVRAHIADAQDDYVGKKGSTVCLGIRKVKSLFLYIIYMEICNSWVSYIISVCNIPTYNV